MRIKDLCALKKHAHKDLCELNNYSGEGWWIVLSVIDVGKISCTMARAGARAPRARMFVTSQVPFRPTHQYAISCTGCRSTICSNHKNFSK